MYDIAIVGGGPAGATLARLVGRRYRVLLLERRPADDGASRAGRQKCCGGLLAPDAQQMLSRFGLGLPKGVLVEPQLFVVRAIDIPRRAGKVLPALLHQHGPGGLRPLAALAAAPRGRAALRLPAARLSAPGEDSVELQLSAGGKTVNERARLLVGADGAASLVRKAMPARSAELACLPGHPGMDGLRREPAVFLRPVRSRDQRLLLLDDPQGELLAGGGRAAAGMLRGRAVRAVEDEAGGAGLPAWPDGAAGRRPLAVHEAWASSARPTAAWPCWARRAAGSVPAPRKG